MPLEESNLGWFHIEEHWNLHVDGDLQQVEVYAINVDEQADGDQYVVKHFNRSGDVITTLTLTESDIRPEVGHRDPISHPFSA